MAYIPGRLLDPKADLVFKKIFSNDADLVKSFLNSVLPLNDDELIETVTYLTPEQAPRTPIQKYSVVDVRCVDQNGRIFIVEMQMGWSPSFWSRLQFGVAKAYVDQLDKGETYNLLNPVYGLALIGQIFEPATSEWYHHYKTVNIKNTEKQIKGLELIFVELPKFKATTHWEKKLGILWFRFLNEIANMKEIPTEFTDVPEIKKAIEKTIEASYTHEERAQYDGYWDQISIEKTIKVDAKREGREEGILEGRKEGILEGRKEGAAVRNREIAAEMLQEKLPDDMILKVSKITLEELSKLKASL